ncbi:MAG: polysaccharide biosynthesis tyrosine autokinase [Verrucomicrobiales bacterium]|nr:polysaccharide biosynthesis tyrosine autokinase [Verrucomicrobiales bacterium]
MNEENSEARLHALDYWQIIRNRYGVVLLAFFLVFMTVCVVTYVLPKEYEGRVRLEIARDIKPLEMNRQNEVGSWASRDPQFVQTQFQIISSKMTLQKVVEDLGLVQKWGKSESDVIADLRRSMEFDEIRGTELIDIKVYRQDNEEASQIANSLWKSYRARRFEFAADSARDAMASLDKELRSQQTSVEQARIKMLKLMEEYGIVDLQEGATFTSMYTDGTPVTTEPEMYRLSVQDKYQAEKDIETIRNNISALTSKTGDELIQQAFSLNLQDTTLQSRFPRYMDAQEALAQMTNGGLGAKHPDVTALEAQIVKIKEQLDQGVVALKSSLETNLEIAEQNFKNMEAMNESKAGESMSKRTANIEYAEAKKDYMTKRQLLSQMEQTYLTERVDMAIPQIPVRLHEQAEPAQSPSKPKVPLLLGIGAVVGLAFGLGLAFFLEYLDTSVKSLEDVERYLEVPVLAVIPKDVGVLHKQSGISPDAEAYRILRTNIEFNRKSADANAITVVSGGAGEGKSTTLVNLAYVCAQGGYNTLMIDGDLRRPKLHTFFDINNSVGLTNYLTTELVLEDVILQTPIDNLYFMPSGILPADAAGILNSRRMSELIADVKSRFDLVLIDSPPILGVSDASVLASEVDLTMIVIQHRKLPRSMLLRVKQAIENVGGNLLGVVLNNVDVRSDSQYQYYTSYYTYYSPSNVPGATMESTPTSTAASSGSGRGRKSEEVSTDDAY